MRLALSGAIGDYRLWRHRVRKSGCAAPGSDRVLARLEELGRGTRKAIFIETPDIPNLGDQAITMAERRLVSALVDAPHVYIESGQSEDVLPYVRDLTTPDDLVLINGGGSMGDLYVPNEERKCAWIDAFRGNRIIYCPQTVTYVGGAYSRALRGHAARLYRSVGDLHLFAREMNSYRLMRDYYPGVDVGVTPDIVLSMGGMDTRPSMADRDGILLCMRDDKERLVTDDVLACIERAAGGHGLAVASTDTVVRGWEGRMDMGDGERAVLSKLDEFRSARLVITDRIHGMLFATITGTPCLAMDNSNGKVGFEYGWLRDLPYTRFASDPAQIPGHVEELLEVGETRFPAEDFLSKFDVLINLIAG